jgi:hypothetical protein
MGGSVIQIRGSTVESVAQEGDEIVVHFGPAYVIKSEGIPGVDASTRWTQSVTISFAEAEAAGPYPSFRATAVSGKISINRMAYVDAIPIPLHSAGLIQLTLVFAAGTEPLTITGTEVGLKLLGHAKYIEHMPAT